MRPPSSIPSNEKPAAPGGCPVGPVHYVFPNHSIRLVLDVRPLLWSQGSQPEGRISIVQPGCRPLQGRGGPTGRQSVIGLSTPHAVKVGHRLPTTSDAQGARDLQAIVGLLLHRPGGSGNNNNNKHTKPGQTGPVRFLRFDSVHSVRLFRFGSTGPVRFNCFEPFRPI